MALSGIISVSGIPGLHKIISQTKNGLIVESLSDDKRRPIYSTQKVSSLEDISIYTMEDDIPLSDVFKKMFEKENGKEVLSHKSEPQKLRDYLSTVIDNVDHERVYNSDISKLFHWYNMLVEKKLMNFDEEKEGEEAIETKAAAAPKKKASPTAKSTVAKASSKKTTIKPTGKSGSRSR
jgi:hypothetical protein